MADVVALVADHAGFELKDTSKGGLDEQAVETIGLGSQTADSIDYPDPAAKLAAALKEGPTQHGLMVCGSGIGVAIASEPLSVDPGEDVLCHLGWRRWRAQRCHRTRARQLAGRAAGRPRPSPDVLRDALRRSPPRRPCGQDVRGSTATVIRPFMGMKCP
jgi:RpiB/LacA/LacB family sugar-phosphate isomerase